MSTLPRAGGLKPNPKPDLRTAPKPGLEAVSWAPWEAILRSRLPPSLVSSAAFGRLGRIFPHLPLNSLIALEIRLAPEPAPVDLAVRLTTPDQARRMAGPALPPPVQGLLTRWAEGGGALSRANPLWLEFDLGADSGDRLPLPSVCARVRTGWGADEVAGELLPALHGRSLLPGQRRLMRRALAAIPPSAELLYVFSMRSRPGAPVRLELGGGDAGELLSCLAELAPAGSAAASAERLAAEGVPLFAGVERCLLAFDILDEIQPRLGLAGRFRRLPPRQPGWEELFARLVAAGLCGPAKRDAALAVSGWDSSRTASEHWPRSKSGEPFPGCLARALSHVKILAQPTGGLEAKMYVNVQWVEGVGRPARI